MRYPYAFKSVGTSYGHKHDTLSFKIIADIKRHQAEVIIIF